LVERHQAEGAVMGDQWDDQQFLNVKGLGPFEWNLIGARGILQQHPMTLTDHLAEQRYRVHSVGGGRLKLPPLLTVNVTVGKL